MYKITATSPTYHTIKTNLKYNIMQTINLNLLKHSWTAKVELKNGQKITIWYTAWDSVKTTVKNIISVSSDLPKQQIKFN